MLITDIRMPGNSGPELYREFMSLPSKRMGVVFISGYNNGHIIPDGSAFLQKPFMSKNVADAINIEIRKLAGLEGRVN